MTFKFHMIARLGGIALAGFALLAAGQAPDADPATLHAAPVEAAAPASLNTDTDAIAQSDETSAPAVETPAIRPASLARLVADVGALPAAPADAETRCLARAVYFEARGEPLAGQLGVAQVILNRRASGRYAASVCGVVDQPGQFTFARRSVAEGSGDWKTARAIAIIAQAQQWLQVAPRAMAFHAARVSPNWGGMQRVAQIGNHVFYR